MSAKQPGIGIVGAGRWGKNLIRAFEGDERCRIVAICDVELVKLNALQAPRGALLTTEFAEFLRSRDLAAVVIATPAADHAAQAVRALESGKHVFVEKPMALSLRDARMMRQAALRADRRLMVGHLLRYHPAVVELERLVDSGALGKITRVVALRIGTNATAGGEGPWWALAPHDVSLARHFLKDEVESVSASRTRFDDETSTIHARLRLTTGSAWLVASTAACRKTRRLVVMGDRAAAVFDDSDARATLTLLRGPHAYHAIEALTDPDAAGSKASSEHGIPVPIPAEEPLRAEAAHFVTALLGGGSIATDANEGCAVTATLEAGTTSIASGGRWVKVPAATVRSSAADERERPQ